MSNMSSPPLRLELKPSRWLAAAIALLAMLAMLAVLRSGLPWAASGPVLPLGLLAWTAVRRQRPETLLFRADGSAVRLLEHDENLAIEARALVERGPLAVLVLAEGGRIRRIPCAPDTLGAPTRRALRLWFATHAMPPRPAAARHGAAHV